MSSATNDPDEVVEPARPDEVDRRAPLADDLDPPALFLASSYKAPIPDPSMLAGYNNVQPGLGNRIAEVWLNGVEAEQARDDAESKAEIEQSKAGLAVAATLAFLCVIAAIVLFAVGRNTGGIALLSAPVILLVGQFLRKRT